MVEVGDVINKLKWSNKDIEVEKQKIFLDVTYFLVGEELELVVQVLEGLDYTKDIHNSL